MIATLTSWKEQNYGDNQLLTQGKAQKYPHSGLSTEFLKIQTIPLRVCNFPLRKTWVTAKGGNVKSAQTLRLKVKHRNDADVHASVPRGWSASLHIFPQENVNWVLLSRHRLPGALWRRRRVCLTSAWRPPCITGALLIRAWIAVLDPSCLLASPLCGYALVWAECQADALHPCLLRQRCGL